jgi:long-subunit fatty acid transport protein
MRAQLVLGQYEDEAPLGSWNVFGTPTAASLGLGGAQFARAWDGSVSLANPALLLTLPRLSASVSASYALASMYKYSLVNTGVVTSAGNLTAGVLGADYGGLAVHKGAWALSLAAAVTEGYGRPRIAINDGGYRLTLDQTGYLRVFHAAIARRLPAGLSVGVGMSYATGRLDRSIVETTVDIVRTVTITDDKSETFRGLFFNGGLAWAATKRLTAALAARSPYVKKGAGRSLLRYEVPAEGTDIRIDAEATNTYRQPWIVGAGVSYRLSEAWSLAADAAWYGWSRYSVTYFDEPLERQFRNVVRAGGGVEFLAPASMFGRSASIPFRLGFSIDPQPMTTIHSSYRALTFGTGLHLGTLAVDLSTSIGREKGSGRSLANRKIVLSIRYIFKD